ncbi:MAG: Glycine cleavage system H protein [bacterium ADurb.Bin478]|nr:MAG: Glycine cleavage system H protein [bacterium ADurb.Bin478]
MKILKDLLYTEEHEWLSVEEDVATIGITDYAQGELGDVVFVELPAVGAEVKQMESFGTIEAVKAVSDLFAPVSGQVVEINEALADQPELVNKDPYVDGWMIKIKMSDLSELESLLKADAYKSLIS